MLDNILLIFMLYGIQSSQQYNNIGLTQASNNLIWSVGKINDDWNFLLIKNETFSALLLNFDIPLEKMPEDFIIIPRYLNSWTFSNVFSP